MKLKSINSKTLCRWHFSIFCVYDSNISANKLNNDLQKIFEWDYKWKISFNPNLNKQAQEVVFFKTLSKICHPKITFNSAPFVFADWEKHLGMFLDKTLNVNLHIKENMSKAIKGIVHSETRQNSSPAFSYYNI